MTDDDILTIKELAAYLKIAEKTAYRFASECLNTHWFMSLQDACQKLEDWRRYYNEERPHSSIGNIPPILLVNSDGETSPP